MKIPTGQELFFTTLTERENRLRYPVETSLWLKIRNQSVCPWSASTGTLLAEWREFFCSFTFWNPEICEGEMLESIPSAKRVQSARHGKVPARHQSAANMCLAVWVVWYCVAGRGVARRGAFCPIVSCRGAMWLHATANSYTPPPETPHTHISLLLQVTSSKLFC